MSFNLNTWLHEPVKYIDKKVREITVPRYERICFLVAANSGFHLRGWGEPGKYPTGHQAGLTQHEAIELVRVQAFLAGLKAAGIDWNLWFDPLYERYITHHKLKQNNPAPKPTPH